MLFYTSFLNHFAFVHDLVRGVGVAAGNGRLLHLLAAQGRLDAPVERPARHVGLRERHLRLAHPHLAGSEAVLDGVSELDEHLLQGLLPAVALDASSAPVRQVELDHVGHQLSHGLVPVLAGTAV